MKIAILTSGILPVPAVKGGAVENLIDFYMEYNEQHHLHDITVYSIFDDAVRQHPALQSDVNHYYYIHTDTMMARIRKKLFHEMELYFEYYHQSIEYFLHEAIRHLRRQHYDVIVLENRPGYALKLKGVTDARLVYHLHNEHLTKETLFYQPIYDAASRIICVSDYIKSRVMTINPQDSKAITVYNGIDLSAFTANPHILRPTVGLTDHDFVIVYMGRVNAEKGIMELIEAMLKLDDIDNIKLLVIGSSFYGADNTDNAFIASLKTKAATLKDRIHFTGFVPYREMPQYLQLGDIAVLPSMWEEPFGLTVIEAMAAGLPLITTHSGGIPEICEGVATIISRDHIVDHLADAILDLYQNQEKRRTMGQAAQQHAKLFSKEHYAKEFFDAISIKEMNI